MRMWRGLYLGCLIVLAGFVSAFATSEASAKAPNHAVHYDFLSAYTDTSELPDLRIGYRQGVLLWVHNINPFLYDLTINGQVVSHNQNFPTFLSALLAGTPPTIARAVAPILPAGQDYETAEREFQKAISDAYLKLPRAETIVLESAFSDDLSKEGILKTIKDRLEKEGLGTDPSALRTELFKLIEKVRTTWGVLTNQYAVLCPGPAATYKDRFEAEKSRWLVFQGTDESTLKRALDNAIRTWDVVRAASFELQGGPFFADGDELILKITASRKAGLGSNLSTNHMCSEKPVVRLRTKGGLKLDFSAGFVFARPTDDVYYLKSENGKSVIIKGEEKDKDLLAVLPSVFLHFYRRTGNDFALAGTLGLGLDTATSAIFDYYLGVSALFGASQRVVLTAGVGVRTISTLSGGYKPNDVLPLKSLPSRL